MVPARGELKPALRDVPAAVLARLHLLERARVARVPDLPLAADLDVLVAIERGAVDREAVLLVDHVVLERPDARGGRVAREVDLGLGDAVARQERRPRHRLR